MDGIRDIENDDYDSDDDDSKPYNEEFIDSYYKFEEKVKKKYRTAIKQRLGVKKSKTLSLFFIFYFNLMFISNSTFSLYIFYLNHIVNTLSTFEP